MSIIVSTGGKNAKRLERTVIEKEDYLQKYIYDNPDSLPLHEIKDNLRLLILAREFPTASGPIDALGVDEDGDVYIIETKLYKNADKRHVIAQMLDYGASLSSTYGADAPRLVAALEQRVTAHFQMGLVPKLQDFYGMESDAASGVLEALHGNVSSGRFRFVVLMDRLDERLKDLIGFVNRNSSFDIIGVELDFYQHGEIEILIPNLFGAETKKVVSPTSPPGTRRKWDAESFFADAKDRLEDEQLAALRGLFDWAIENADGISWGTGAVRGSFNAKWNQVHVRSLFTAQTDGLLFLNFRWVTDTETGTEHARRLAEELQAHKLVALEPDHLSRFVSVRADQWAPRVEEFIDVFERVTAPPAHPTS